MLFEDAATVNRLLVPDGRYITVAGKSFHDIRIETTSRIASLVSAQAIDDLPRLIIAFGKCRVGSTALTNAIGQAGIPAFFQPFKSVLRQVLCGEANLSYFPDLLSKETVFCKEMFGPYTSVESNWNPFLDLLDVGYPREKITLIWLERDPFDALTSWKRNWSVTLDETTLLDHFEQASKAAARASEKFEELGIKVVRFNYDSLKQHPDAIFRLFSEVRVDPVDKHRVTQWGEGGDLASPKSAITFTCEPAIYGAIKVHSNRPEYKFVSQPSGLVPESLREELYRRGLYEIYKENFSACVGRSDPVLRS